MNSKFLQDKVQEIEDEAIEMRLLKRSEKNHECADDKEKVISLAQSTVSLKHYDQVENLLRLKFSDLLNSILSSSST